MQPGWVGGVDDDEKKEEKVETFSPSNCWGRLKKEKKKSQKLCCCATHSGDDSADRSRGPRLRDNSSELWELVWVKSLHNSKSPCDILFIILRSSSSSALLAPTVSCHHEKNLWMSQCTQTSDLLMEKSQNKLYESFLSLLLHEKKHWNWAFLIHKIMFDCSLSLPAAGCVWISSDSLSLSLLHKAAIVDDWRVMNCTTGKWECIYVLSYIFSNPRIKQQKEKKTRHTISLSAVLSSAISNWPLNCFDSLCGDLSRMNVAVWTCCCAQPPTVDI